MARTNIDRETRKLQASYKSLQEDLSAVMEDLERMATSGKDIGLEKTKEQIDRVQEQIASMIQEPAECSKQAVDTVRRQIAENPMAVLAAAFATGLAAASLFARRN